MVVKAIFEHFKLVLINVYALTGPHRVIFFLQVLTSVLRKVSADEFLFLEREFNYTENDILDRNHSEPHKPSKSAMELFLKGHELTDVWRTMNGKKRQYTWTHSG